MYIAYLILIGSLYLYPCWTPKDIMLILEIGFSIFYAMICLYKHGPRIVHMGNNASSSISNVNTKRFKYVDLNRTLLRHCHLGHINKKCISALQKCGLLSPFEFHSNNRCKACLMGKMT